MVGLDGDTETVHLTRSTPVYMGVDGVWILKSNH